MPQAFWPPALICVKLMRPAMGTGVGTQSNPYASRQPPEMSSGGMTGPAPSLENSFELHSTHRRRSSGSVVKRVCLPNPHFLGHIVSMIMQCSSSSSCGSGSRTSRRGSASPPAVALAGGGAGAGE
jgi:hypothetical protein